MARPTTRATTRARKEPAAPDAAPRAIVRDFTGGRDVEVSFDVRTVYDFVFSLSDDAGSSDDIPAADREWLATSKAALGESIKGELDLLFATDTCVVIAGLAVDRPDITDAASLLDAIRAADTNSIARLLFAEYLRKPDLRAAAEAAMAGDQAAIDTIIADLPDHKHMPASRILRNQDAVQGAIVGVLEAWLKHFQPIEGRILSMLRRDMDLRAGDRTSLEAHELIERTTGGIRWLSEPGVRRVILAPSYFARPYNYLLGADDWRMFGYPIADAALDASDPFAPPPSIVRLHRALGDGTRLRILRLLRDRDWYLTEIAGQLELSKPTIKHHLALLRAAGLVTLTEEGGLSYYSLRRERLDDASADLKRFLIQ